MAISDRRYRIHNKNPARASQGSGMGGQLAAGGKVS
jgi:hypothetical protein